MNFLFVVVIILTYKDGMPKTFYTELDKEMSLLVDLLVVALVKSMFS